MKGNRIEIKEKIKFLGLELHRVLNLGSSGQRKRKLLSTVVVSKLLYASPIWAKALVFNRNVVILCIIGRMILAHFLE
ncbi:Reverse transcriptase domain-containing protein [Aphis craccivora]|uniref:Reverse transcriptase domain-containing protein n=1 Tax=Aphis craccivora TaxID=307492 RepID=A0A6G0ZK86_APHCR|nr:Reverse transcriptase domain-containing protein [Aphis craccivora]